MMRREEDPTSAGQPEGSWRGTGAGRLCPGCLLNESWSRICSRTMTASSHKVRRCFICSHNLGLTFVTFIRSHISFLLFLKCLVQNVKSYLRLCFDRDSTLQLSAAGGVKRISKGWFDHKRVNVDEA